MAILKKSSGYDEEMDEDKVTAPALLPKSILMGKSAEVGDKIVLRIDKIMEDEISVSYDTESKSTEPTEPDTEDEAAEETEPEQPEQPAPMPMSGYE